MIDDLEDHTPEEIAQGSQEFIKYLEEDDGKEVIWNYRTLMINTVLLYDFSKRPG